jgi:hypothetical protein
MLIAVLSRVIQLFQNVLLLAPRNASGPCTVCYVVACDWQRLRLMNVDTFVDRAKALSKTVAFQFLEP